MNTPVRVGETIEGSRTVRNRPYQVLKCSRRQEVTSLSAAYQLVVGRHRASGPAAAARPVEAGLGPARDGWPPTSALALLVKMAAVAIAATKVQAYSAQAPVVFRLLSHFAHTRAPRGTSLPRFEPAAKSCSLEPRPTLPPRPQLLSSPEDWCLICCLPADAAGEPGGPRYYKEVLTRCLPAIFYPYDSEHECDRTIGSFSHQSEITREQLSLPLASPPSPPGIRGILWVVQSIDLW